MNEWLIDPRSSPLSSPKAQSGQTSPPEIRFGLNEISALFIMGNPSCNIVSIKAFEDPDFTIPWKDNFVVDWDESSLSGVFKTYDVYTMKIIFV